MTSADSFKLPASTRHATVTRLRARIDAVMADLKPHDNRFALVDFPNHDNIGDSAIYLGELAFFKDLGLRPAYADCKDGYDEAAMTRTIGSDAPIYFHGGGNFGDVWPWFQAFREGVMARFPGRPIVQMPQTLHFSSQACIDQTARAIDRHGAFKLLVRDQRSYDFAVRHFDCDVRLCPDMAFCLGPLPRPATTRELLLHLREDREAAAEYDVSALLADPRVERLDWPAEPRSFRRDAKVATLLASALSGRVFEGRVGVKESYIHRLAERRVNRGLALLGSSRTLITDRLHGHILSLLMDVPHCVLDNSYGKTSGYMTTWGTASPTARPAASIDEAVRLLREFAGLTLDPTCGAPRAAAAGAAFASP